MVTGMQAFKDQFNLVRSCVIKTEYGILWLFYQVVGHPVESQQWGHHEPLLEHSELIIIFVL